MVPNKVVKRDGRLVEFSSAKIESAIVKAMKYGNGVKPVIAHNIANEIQKHFDSLDRDLSISEIESLIYTKLIEKKQKLTAKSYEGYRAVREHQRKINTTDNKIKAIIKGTDNDINDNSNKDTALISTMRDLVAEEISKDIALRELLPPHISQAHNEGLIYVHDLGHYLNPSFNCCLVNLKDMLENGTVINGKMVERPKSFRTACTIATQIIAQVASGQFGGQTISIAHLAPFVRISKERIRKEVIKDFQLISYKDESEFMNSDLELIEEITIDKLRKEVKDGIQTFNYQVNTLLTSNGRFSFAVIKSR